MEDYEIDGKFRELGDRLSQIENSSSTNFFDSPERKIEELERKVEELERTMETMKYTIEEIKGNSNSF